MAEGLHCLFYCKWCLMPIWLLHEKLDWPFEDQVPRIDSRSIGAVCGSCWHIGSYSLFRDSPDFGPSDQVVYTKTTGEPIFLGLLRCDDKGCESEVPLFFQWQGERTGREYQQLFPQLLWHSLKCTQGHAIKSQNNVA
jgi:hypothetical protein